MTTETNQLEFLLVKFDPPITMHDWLEIKQAAIEDGSATHMKPHWWRGKLIGIMFDDADHAVMFKLSTQHPTKS